MSVREVPVVLVIDDSQDIHDLVGARLKSEGVSLRAALDAAEGLRAAAEHRPDLILLDLDLAGSSGIEVCRALKADPDLAVAPVIFLTGTVDVATKVQAFDAGAVDYITKPFDSVELKARVRSALRTKRLHDLLATRAQLDGLTGLWNRAYFDARLADEVAFAGRQGRPVALVLLDVDHFKRINDTHGHPFGDTVLRAVAEALTGELRRGEAACRYGGEEFGVILREADLAGAEAVAERLRRAVEGLALVNGTRPVPVTASFGVASGGPGSMPAPAQLLAEADRTLYRAKQEGRNRVCRPGA
jgi:diguanylate cyclase (GGDEF)-like protein